MLQPYTYCIVENPVLLNQETKKPVIDEFGQVKVRIGEKEVRTSFTHPKPFALYPEEIIVA